MVSLSRRTLLQQIGVGSGIALTGCLGDTSSGRTSPTRQPERETTSEYSTLPEQHPTPSEPMRCQGEPVSAERSMSDEPGYEDGFEYFPSNETVRIVAARSGGEPVRFKSMSIERWSQFESGKVGLQRVREATATRLGTSDFSSGVGDPPASTSTDSIAIRLGVVTEFDQQGEVISTPSVPVSKLVATAPRSVDVTMSLKEHTLTQRIPVFAKAEIYRIE